ncbi:MAG TPA: S-layer homology domain-containing protein [Chloroflexia bacterium]
MPVSSTPTLVAIKPRLALLIVVTLAFAIGGALLANAARAKASPLNTYTVTSTSDDGAGSLRQAINAANSHAGLDLIDFNIPATGVQTITLLSALPTITDPVTIDGYTQSGAHANTLAVGNNAAIMVQLDGSGVPQFSGSMGLRVSGGGSTIRGLAIFNFYGSYSESGIWLEGAGGNVVQGNYLGLTAFGTASARGNEYGVFISGSPNNVIGGTTPADRNVLSHNYSGVQIQGSGATANKIQGNYIGTNPAGSAAMANENAGIAIVGGPQTLVGGTVAGARNLLSGNDVGVVVQESTTGDVTIQGNYIGTDATGSFSVANDSHGIAIQTSIATVGGTTAGAGNVISGNKLIGISVSSSQGGLIQGNYIGTNATGTYAIITPPVSGGGVGIAMVFSSNYVIGGTSGAARNIISGNWSAGVQIGQFNSSSDGRNHRIQGNYIGTDVSGTQVVANGVGVRVSYTPQSGSGEHVIGGTAAGAGNLISGNATGVEINGSSIPFPEVGNWVQGNYIGTDVTGAAPLGNTGSGIVLSVAGKNVIGGTSPGARNIISANGQFGITISGEYANSNLIQGNHIGTGIAGYEALGNGRSGVQIGAAGPENIVGGMEAGAGNLIAFNAERGLNVVEPNVPLGYPIDIKGAAALSNRIWSNGGLGIDLGADGVTPNDPGDGDDGANHLQNFPVLSAASSNGGTTVVTGTLNSTAGTTFTLQFFASDAQDPSGYGEGQYFLGSYQATTDGAGNVSFVATLPVATSEGRYITATAIDPKGNNSEFSAYTQIPWKTMTPTSTPTPSATATAIPSATACLIQFDDVPATNTFFPYVRCLACRGIVSGYPCGGPGEPCNSPESLYFRAGFNITRGQIAKMVSSAAALTGDPGAARFEDVPQDSPFFVWINRLSSRGYISGYTCGQAAQEPCVGPANLPYFRPGALTTRGQLAKIVSEAARLDNPPVGQTFTDVPQSNPFYLWVQRLVSRDVMAGYPCGSIPSEPCDDQQRTYFRPNASVTRGQAAKIISNTFFPNCQTPARPDRQPPIR